MNHAWAEIWKGESVALLHALHLLTADGKLNQDARRKLKQVAHFEQFLRPFLDEFIADDPNLRIVDAGAGKSYLGLILYDLWIRHHSGARLTLIEPRGELVKTVESICRESAFERVEIIQSRIEPLIGQLEEQPTAVIALHACDTATDEALLLGLKGDAKLIALVPCCQAEAARLLEEDRTLARTVLGELFSHPHHRREFGSHITNVFRSLFLEAHGYKVRVTELATWEHTAKNELILAKRVQRSNPVAARRLAALRDLLPLPLRLFREPGLS